MSSPRRRKPRRTQADILISTIKKLPSNKAVSINSMAERSNSTWRTTKKNLDMLVKAGIIQKIKTKKRIYYKNK